MAGYLVLIWVSMLSSTVLDSRFLFGVFYISFVPAYWVLFACFLNYKLQSFGRGYYDGIIRPEWLVHTLLEKRKLVWVAKRERSSLNVEVQLDEFSSVEVGDGYKACMTI
jgi:hypothetical protein